MNRAGAFHFVPHAYRWLTQNEGVSMFHLIAGHGDPADLKVPVAVSEESEKSAICPRLVTS